MISAVMPWSIQGSSPAPVRSAVPSSHSFRAGTYSTAWLNTASDGGRRASRPPGRVRTSTGWAVMPSSESITAMSMALSLQSPNLRANTWGAE
jgi:hypothetical protein